MMSNYMKKCVEQICHTKSIHISQILYLVRRPCCHVAGDLIVSALETIEKAEKAERPLGATSPASWATPSPQGPL